MQERKFHRFIKVLVSMVYLVFLFAIPAFAEEVIHATLTAPPNVPPPTNRTKPAHIQIDLETSEVKGAMADGVEYEYWTFGGTVPGPMIRVREGDSIDLMLKNSPSSKFPHSIDLHAVNGPGGGAKVTQTPPGGMTSFHWKALNPGLYVYHCATPHIPTHIANGMYGLILVEPAKGMPKVDKEFYVVQSEFYTTGAFGEKGLQAFNIDDARHEQPHYVVFNGHVGALTGDHKLKAKVGDNVRLYVGNGGPNLVSSFHVIGEVFDKVYPEGAVGSAPNQNVQTTLIPAGGSAIVEMHINVPATYLIVDHSIFRVFEKGAVGMLEATGDEDPEVFKTLQAGMPGGGGH